MDDALTRHFLDWKQPAIESAIQWCVDRYLNPHGELDLGNLTIITPGRRASRLFLSHLVDHCQSNGIALIPPTLCTPSNIAREILRYQYPQASEMSKKLAWVKTLQDTDPHDLSVIVPNPPDLSRWDQWMGLASWLQSTSSQLSDAGLRMNEVRDKAETLLLDSEIQRWDVLGDIQDRYEQLLIQHSTVDDHLQSLKCIKKSHFQDQAQKHFVLLGVPELGYIPRSCIAQRDHQFTALIFAPESISERFDEFGCVKSSEWIDHDLDIEESRIQFSMDPISMCEEGLAQLAKRSNPLDTTSCVIGLADETVLGTLRRTTAMISPSPGITIHDPAGKRVRNTSVGRLIELIDNFLAEQTYTTLSAMIRHPHFEQALTARYSDEHPDQRPPNAKWLHAIDELLQDHVLLNSNQLPQGVRVSTESQARFVLNAALGILDHLTQLPISEPTLDEWSARLIQTLKRIYDCVELDESPLNHRNHISQLQAVQSIHEDLLIAKSQGHDLPKLAATSALSIILSRLGEIHVPDQPSANSIESVGWLELALDPSPIAVVLGMNDSSVPGSVTHDPLLPGSLRAQLGIRTNTDRLARDAYLMTAINNSRDAVFMTTRTSTSNEPTTPSRLLFQSKGQSLASRMRRFVDHEADRSVQLKLSQPIKPSSIDQSLRQLTISTDYQPPESMSVTEFDAYLRSPASWYIERSLRLREIQTNARELNALQIGNLAHAVLDAFGKDETMRVLDDPTKIDSALQYLLNDRFIHTHGSSHPGAVKVQYELLSYRLQLFAKHQAMRTKLGWEITHTEWTPPESSKTQLDTDDQPMPLRGKVDRIDIHPDGKIAVIDYKTGRVTDPIKAHFIGDEWIKLQLPLYRHLVAELIDGRELELGYAGLPLSESDDVWKTAQWDQEQLDDADRTAARIVNEIRALKPGDPLPEGDYPPSAGIAGFITGHRFESGGFELIESDDSTQDGGDQ